MEGHRARKLTTAAVGVGLGLAVLCLIVGLVLGLGQPEEAFAVLGVRAIGEGLNAGKPSAWLSLGALLLVATPCVRLVGLLAVFRAEGHSRALGACALLLVLLVLGIGHALS